MTRSDLATILEGKRGRTAPTALGALLGPTREELYLLGPAPRLLVPWFLLS